MRRYSGGGGGVVPIAEWLHQPLGLRHQHHQCRFDRRHVAGSIHRNACVSLRLGLPLSLDLIEVVRIKGYDRHQKSPLNVEHLCKIGFGERVLIIERVKETALQISLAVGGIELILRSAHRSRACPTSALREGSKSATTDFDCARVSKDGCTARTRCHPSRRALKGAPQDEVFICSQAQEQDRRPIRNPASSPPAAGTGSA